MQKQVSEEKSNALTQRDWFREYKCSKKETQKVIENLYLGNFLFKTFEGTLLWVSLGWRLSLWDIIPQYLQTGQINTKNKVVFSKINATISKQNICEWKRRVYWYSLVGHWLSRDNDNKHQQQGLSFGEQRYRGCPKKIVLLEFLKNKPMKYIRASLDQLDHWNWTSLHHFEPLTTN